MPYSFIYFEIEALEIKYILKKVLKRSALGCLSLGCLGLNSRKNVQSLIGLAGKEYVSRIGIFQTTCLNMVKGIGKKYENII